MRLQITSASLAGAEGHDLSRTVLGN